MATQKYEQYWKFTVEYTDINGDKFRKTLKMIYDQISNGNVNYQNLTNDIMRIFTKKDSGSARKSINQFIKLGFIEPGLSSINPLTFDFLNAKSDIKRQIIFSHIFYSNAKLSASYNNKSSINEIKFFIKTLEEVNEMTYDEIAGIMTVDLNTFPNQYLTKSELTAYTAIAKADSFATRKKNQIGYLIGFLKRMDDIEYKNQIIKFKNSANNILTKPVDDGKRDNYLHLLYKRQLQEESKIFFTKNIPICMIEKLGYPCLIASHIKPFKNSLDSEKYDAENGILISSSLDSLFDKNKISFDANTGLIIISQSLDIDLINHLQQYCIDPKLLTPKRKSYLIYHNQNLK